MKASAQHNILLLIGGIFGYLGLFHTAAGLPDWVQIPCTLIWVACFGRIFWLQRRAKGGGGPSSIPGSAAQNRRHMWTLLAVLVVSCLVWPFLLPYTGIKSPPSQLGIISAIIFVIFAPLVIVAQRRREKANQSLEATADRSFESL